jgi:hypothetical protein
MWRRLVPMVASAAYVAATALWIAGGRGLRVWTLAAAAIVVAIVAARRATAAARWALWGLAVVLASLAAGGEHPPATLASPLGPPAMLASPLGPPAMLASPLGQWLDAFGSVGALASACAAYLALVRIPSLPGLAKSRPVRGRPMIAVMAVAWGAAIIAGVATPRARWAGALAGQGYACTIAAVIASAAVLLGASVRASLRRKLELGVASRAEAATTLAASALGVVLLVGIAHADEADRLGRLAIAFAAAVIVWVARHRDAVLVTRVARRVVVLALVGGPVALLGAFVAAGRPTEGAVATLLTAIAALGIGTLARFFEEPMRPARGALLDAIAKAHEPLTRAEPDDAIREALFALRASAGPDAPSPELWSFAPTRVATVNAAGYLREREAELPEIVVFIAAGEPEATLRSEVLEALEVRRPDLRPLARWMLEGGALTATVVTREGEPEGLLVVPQGKRDERVTLEEARALKGLADALAGACHARSVQARMLARVNAAAARADALEEEVEKQRHESALEAGRHALATARLARPATVGTYAAASRMALDALERRTSAGAPIAVVAPSGVDAVPYIARAHLAGARSARPLVLVDATSAREHDPERWRDPTQSPLALADRGMLVLLDGASLPLELQRTIARALAEKRLPWERAEALDIQLALTAVEPPDALVESGRLDAALALRLADARDAPIALARLRERAEDIRAILTDRLAREGLRIKGTPVGIERAAFARLVDHPFLGEDTELAAVVQRLVASCPGDVVRLADVEALGLPTVERQRKKPALA